MWGPSCLNVTFLLLCRDSFLWPTCFLLFTWISDTHVGLWDLDLGGFICRFVCSPTQRPYEPGKDMGRSLTMSKIGLVLFDAARAWHTRLITDIWLPTHPYLIKNFILVLVQPIEQSIYWLHRAAAAAGASTSCAWFGESPNLMAPMFIMV